jgi:hypothetical protein
MKLAEEHWSALIALAAAAYAAAGLGWGVIPTFGARDAGSGPDGEPSPMLKVTGPAARLFGIGFAVVALVSLQSVVLGFLGVAGLLAAAWFKAK